MNDLSKTADLLNAEYRSLTDDDYHGIACIGSLKGLLKGKSNIALLAQEAQDARAVLLQIQTRLLQRAWRFPLRYLPLMLCRGPARSGANFLRWRNQENNRSGTQAWGELLQSSTVSTTVHTALLAIEQDRIQFNMQMSIVTFVIRQTRECQQKMALATTLAATPSPTPSTPLRR